MKFYPNQLLSGMAGLPPVLIKILSELIIRNLLFFKFIFIVFESRKEASPLIKIIFS